MREWMGRRSALSVGLLALLATGACGARTSSPDLKAFLEVSETTPAPAAASAPAAPPALGVGSAPMIGRRTGGTVVGSLGRHRQGGQRRRPQHGRDGVRPGHHPFGAPRPLRRAPEAGLT